jgi:hypothetical protein
MSGGLLARVWSNAFDPQTLNLSFYVRAAYPGSMPWSGIASAGASGGRNMVHAGNEPSLGSFSGAQFAAASSNIGQTANGQGVSTLFGANGSGFVLFNAASAHATSGNQYGDGTILTDAMNAEIDVTFTTAGFGVVVLDNSVTYKSLPPIACGTGAWHLGQWKFDGVNLKGRVDNGAWSSLACGPYTPVNPGNFTTFGLTYSANFYLDATIVELATSTQVFSDATFDQIRGYMTATYGVGV